MKSEYSAGDLVGKRKSVFEKGWGVLIEQDTVHPKFWKVLSSEGVVNWFESNFEKVNECKNGSQDTY
tara:strand:- start:587 stop:787 length:201 start_codon:yes stop_codon:yes gene_type:complete